MITDSHTHGDAGLGAGHSVSLQSTGLQFSPGLLPSHSKQIEAHHLGSSRDAQLRFEPVPRGSEPTALSSMLCSPKILLGVSWRIFLRQGGGVFLFLSFLNSLLLGVPPLSSQINAQRLILSYKLLALAGFS